MTRAQTTMDFAAGVSVFLVTVAFAFAFVPGITTPFTGAGAGDPVSANRIADDLATDSLGAPEDPYRLDAEQVSSFFADGTDPAARLPIESYRNVNATLETPDGAVAVVNGTTAAAGDAVPQDGDVTVAWRIVDVDDRTLELVVRVW
ncbi:DUF7287 family protein [Halobacterium litoreum]|uniref:Uncharacterized protein n=1 Tax=Halobacterium litoreum TaxID=2039234 RepID=A0ABD5NID8_9EURY|nr:hypothetical protein [Halobacterium litoreum]UHH12143.1 hypothetical protein LT972_08240 [Halobacterium litoreum]